MVGREDELARLERVWQRTVAERQPQLVTIFGLPGLGKSRLVHEFTEATRAAGARVLWGRSLPYGETAAYGPFAQQVHEVAGILGDDAPALALEKLGAAIASLIDGEDAESVLAHVATMLGLWPVDEAVRHRHALFFSARRVVEALAEHQPTVLVFEDLHWADPSLLDLIEMLSARVEGVSLMLVCDARPELQEKRPGWASHASTTIALEALGTEQSRELAERLLARAAGRELGQSAMQIGAAGEGNPLFIEELVASLAEHSAPAGGELPSSIRGIIAARLDAIPQAEREVLLSAAVVGRVFWDGVLAGVDLPALLDSLEGRDLIRRERSSHFRGQRQYRFKHALIRDVAYAALPRVKRRAIHAAVASFYEQLGVADEAPGVIAYNWVEAGEPQRAIDYFVAAGDRASSSWAKREAAVLYREALELLTDDDLVRRRSIRLKLAVAQQMVVHLDLSDVAPRDRLS
jgi:predicted ATPase